MDEPVTGKTRGESKTQKYVANHPGQLSLPSLRSKPAWLGLRWGEFTRVVPHGRWHQAALRRVSTKSY